MGIMIYMVFSNIILELQNLVNFSFGSLTFKELKYSEKSIVALKDWISVIFYLFNRNQYQLMRRKSILEMSCKGI